MHSVERATRVAIVTNIPAPYRLPVYAALATEPGIALRVVFCSGREPDRAWDLSEFRFDHEYLKERYATWSGRFVHFNPDVWAALSRWRPDVVVTTGFNPTHLLAYAWARRHGAQHVAMTDGTRRSEAALTSLHRALRRHVYTHTAAFVGASEGSFDLYRSYGVRPSAMFKSHLCADNDDFARSSVRTRDVDLLFCGRFVELKQPLFALRVAAATARRLGRRLRMLFVGSGELEGALAAAAAQCTGDVETEFAGFARQSELPGHYARARLLLFPTLGDTWGVVANEACAAGVPVLTCEAAGVAGELVRDGENGMVLPLSLSRWVDATTWLLTDQAAHAAMALRGRELVQPYTYANAAHGLAAAVRHAMRERNGNWTRPDLRAEIVPHQPRPRVAIVQRRLTCYRVPLFERLRQLLDERGVDLDVIVGDPKPGERLLGDAGHLPWARHARCTYHWRGRLCWQRAWPALRGADLAVVTQENKMLLNLVLALQRRRLPLALWGHGRNFQAVPGDAASEWLKRRLIRRADWWFAYTSLSRELVLRAGFRADRVTVLNNSDDTESLRADLASLASEPDGALRRRLGVGDGPVVLVLSSLHSGKRIDFVIETARRARHECPDLQLLVVGDGPDRELVQEAARTHAWVTWAGARRGVDKAACLRLATVMLQPHGVGLVAVDSLVAGVPLVTLAAAGHGPEVAYLRDDSNCVIVARNDPTDCALALLGLIREDQRRHRLAAQCRADARQFGIDAMAERFCDGILLALRGTPGPAPASSARIEARTS